MSATWNDSMVGTGTPSTLTVDSARIAATKAAAVLVPSARMSVLTPFADAVSFEGTACMISVGIAA